MSINPRLSIKTIVRDDEDTLSFNGAMAIAPYSYDKAGNNQNNSAVYNLLNNQMQESALYTITYDSMGNIKTKYNKLNKTTSTYTFNARNQLTQYIQEDENNQTTKTLTYTYDAFNRRVSKTEDGVEQKYLYDGDDIVAILDSNNAVIATITHDESIDTPLSITNSNGTFYYHRDHQGSIIALTDSTGAVVESFTYDNHYGTITNHTKTVETNNPYAYTGRELDTDELYYYRARYYDPALQRFLGEDPIGFGSGDFNWYRYVGNSPLNWIDSLGLTATCPASPPVNKKGWKPYVGNPWFFHCGYDTFLEDRKPTPDDPIAECVYDDDKKLVDDNHKYPGCKGTPDQYPASNPWDHTFNDSGGIWSCGWDAFKDSRRKDWDDIKKHWK